VSCLVVPEEDATESSLVENLKRKAPHPADIYTAFNNLIKEGQSVPTIAKTHGITELQVEKYLRLGKVHKTLFNLFKRDELNLDQVTAFASTADTKLQIATFKAMGQGCGFQANYIRREIQKNRHSSDTALAKLVSIDAYREAGGAIENDFFTETCFFLDLDLLVRLAEEKLHKAAAQLKGWKWVSISLEGDQVLQNYQRLPNKKIAVPPADSKALQDIEDKINVLEEMDDALFTDEHQDQYENLENDKWELMDKIDRECTVIEDEHMAYGGCVVTFSQHSGEIEIHKGLMNSDDVAAFQKADSNSSCTRQSDHDEPKAKAKPDMSASLLMDLGRYRRSIIKAELASSSRIAVDLLHFQTVLKVIGKGNARYVRVLDMSFSSVDDESSIGDYKKTEAAKVLASRFSKLDTGWMSLKSEAKQFEAFRALSSSKRNALVSYCVALQLLGGSSKPGEDKLIESIIDEVGIDFKKYWRPTRDNFFNRLTKPTLLKMGKKWHGQAWLNKHENSTKKDIVERFHHLFHGSKGAVTDKEVTIRNEWLPDHISK